MLITTEEGRYDRQELISWWDQDRLRTARILVVGAGALGNEVVKNLLLIGIGHIDVIDLDIVERSNLARCVFFREDDNGSFKSEVVANGAAAVNPESIVTSHVGDVTSIGLGWLQQFDLVIGALDNREARLWINQACRKLGLTWVDGAIEGIRGVVKVFPPTGACYECTLGERDREILSKRRSCSLLSTEEMLTGKVPTTSS
jgi:adenylyltransferase/sulfurtransferase